MKRWDACLYVKICINIPNKENETFNCKYIYKYNKISKINGLYEKYVYLFVELNMHI